MRFVNSICDLLFAVSGQHFSYPSVCRALIRRTWCMKKVRFLFDATTMANAKKKGRTGNSKPNFTFKHIGVRCSNKRCTVGCTVLRAALCAALDAAGPQNDPLYFEIPTDIWAWFNHCCESGRSVPDVSSYHFANRMATMNIFDVHDLAKTSFSLDELESNTRIDHDFCLLLLSYAKEDSTAIREDEKIQIFFQNATYDSESIMNVGPVKDIELSSDC